MATLERLDFLFKNKSNWSAGFTKYWNNTLTFFTNILIKKTAHELHVTASACVSYYLFWPKQRMLIKTNNLWNLKIDRFLFTYHMQCNPQEKLIELSIYRSYRILLVLIRFWHQKEYKVISSKCGPGWKSGKDF